LVTDRRPSRPGLRREYDASDRLQRIAEPPRSLFTDLFRRIENARDAEERPDLNAVCVEFLDRLSEFYGVPRPTLKLLGGRPHSTREGRLSYELFGDYTLGQAKIRLWTRTPIQKRWTASRTLLSTLCHEFMHHLDVTNLEFPKSYHTTGFFERAHRLYQCGLGQAYYPLAWYPADSDGSRAIDWVLTNRRKTSSAPE